MLTIGYSYIKSFGILRWQMHEFGANSHGWACMIVDQLTNIDHSISYGNLVFTFLGGLPFLGCFT
jgi:hypothetical protein